VLFTLIVLVLLPFLVFETSFSHIETAEVHVKSISISKSQPLPECDRELLKEFPERTDWEEIREGKWKCEDRHKAQPCSERSSETH
jgi:hypothetical protein